MKNTSSNWFIQSLVLCTATAGVAVGVELRVPACTAYTIPDADGARISERGGVTRWNNPEIKVVWFGEFKQTGEITVRLVLKLPADVESKLRLSVAGQSRETTVKGAGETHVTADFSKFNLKETGYHRFTLESLNERGKPIGDLDALLLDGPALADAHFNLKERRNAASVHLSYPVPEGTNV